MEITMQLQNIPVSILFVELVLNYRSNPMKYSLRSRIAQRLKEVGGWVHKGQIEARAKEWGYLADGATRRCRELENEGIIERKDHNGSTMYRYVPTETLKSTYTIVGGRAVEVEQLTLV